MHALAQDSQYKNAYCIGASLFIMARDATLVQPMQQEMGNTELGKFFRHDSLLVKQTMRGCLKECLGCEAKSEFSVAPLQWNDIEGYKVGFVHAHGS